MLTLSWSFFPIWNWKRKSSERVGCLQEKLVLQHGAFGKVILHDLAEGNLPYVGVPWIAESSSPLTSTPLKCNEPWRSPTN